LMCFFALSIGSMASSSLFELGAEGEAIFTFGRMWTTVSLLNKDKINCVLIEGDRSRDEACNDTDICVGVPVGLTSLAMRVEGLIDGKGQQITN
jgi:hypothetical protein